MKKNKKLLLLLLLLLVILVFLISSAIFSYYYRRSPKNIVREIILNEETLEQHLTENFINEINDSPSNKEYLEQAVKDYDVRQVIQEIRSMSKSSDEEGIMVIVETTTINIKTGFTVVTLDTYMATLKKIDGSWKIDNYEIINSKTI